MTSNWAEMSECHSAGDSNARDDARLLDVIIHPLQCLESGCQLTWNIPDQLVMSALGTGRENGGKEVRIKNGENSPLRQKV